MFDKAGKKMFVAFLGYAYRLSNLRYLSKNPGINEYGIFWLTHCIPMCHQRNNGLKVILHDVFCKEINYFKPFFVIIFRLDTNVSIMFQSETYIHFFLLFQFVPVSWV